jgi:hypothetical protein
MVHDSRSAKGTAAIIHPFATLAAVEKMPEDWDEVEIAWLLVRRAEQFNVYRSADRLRRKAFENAVRTRGL